MPNRNNVVRIKGNLGTDPEVSETSNGTKITTFNLADGGGKYFDAEGKEKVARTNWTRIKMWGNLSNAAQKRLSNGSRVLVEGSLVNDSYENDKGETVYTSHVKAHSFEVIEVPQKG